MPNCANRAARPQRIERDFAFAELQPHPVQPDLLQEAQIVIGDGFGIQAVAELGIPRIGLVDLRGARLRQ